MRWSLIFFINSILLGVGLAMDAFSISMADGLNEPKMSIRRMFLIAGVYGFFQFVMPMIGWVCVHTIVLYFNAFDKIIPGIALILLIFCGSKMVIEGTKGDEGSETDLRLGAGTLMIQGVATSIDALSVGVTIADYCFFMASAASLIISVVTFLICVAGLIIGKKVGITLSKKAAIFGGIILICIGIEIFIRGVFF